MNFKCPNCDSDLQEEEGRLICYNYGCEWEMSKYDYLNPRFIEVHGCYECPRLYNEISCYCELLDREVNILKNLFLKDCPLAVMNYRFSQEYIENLENRNKEMWEKIDSLQMHIAMLEAPNVAKEIMEKRNKNAEENQN